MDTTALGPRVWTDPGRAAPRREPDRESGRDLVRDPVRDPVREPVWELVRRPRPSRSATPLVAALLAGVTALVLLGVAWALPSPRSAAASFEADANKAAVLGYYAAADDLLRTGSVNSLAHTLETTVVEHDPVSGALADRANLERRLLGIGAAYRNPRLTVLDVVADAEWVAARVELRAEGRNDAAGLALDGATPARQATERFRLVDGEIVEHWPAVFASERAIDLPPTLVTPSPMDAVAAVARFAFAPGAELPAVVGQGPELIALQAGALAVDLNRPALLHRQGASESGWIRTTRDGETVRLLPGDLLLVPTGVRRQLRNAGTTPAVMLGVGAFPRSIMYHDYAQSRVEKTPLFARLYNPGLLRFPTEHAPGVVGEVLSTASAEAAAGRPVALTGGRIVLAPGEGIAPHAVADSELLAVEAGMLGVAGTPAAPIGDAEAGPLQSVRGGVPPSPRTGAVTEVFELALGPTPGVITAGDAVVRRDREVAGLTNLGEGEATVLVVTVGPAAEPAVAVGDR